MNIWLNIKTPKSIFQWILSSIPQEVFKQEHTVMAQNKQIIPLLTQIPKPRDKWQIKTLLKT